MPASDERPFTRVGRNGRPERSSKSPKSPNGDKRNGRNGRFRKDITADVLAPNQPPTARQQRSHDWRKRESERVKLAVAATDLQRAQLARKVELDAQRAAAQAARDAADAEQHSTAAREERARRRAAELS